MCCFVQLLQRPIHLYNQRITPVSNQMESTHCGQSQTRTFQNKSITRPHTEGTESPLEKQKPGFQNPPPTPPPCCCFVLGQNPGFCCLFFQMVQFLFLSAWAWLNPIAVNGKCVLISMTGAANLPAANKSHLPSHRYLRTHPPTHTYTQSSRIPEDMPPLKLEIALQRDANAVQK